MANALTTAARVKDRLKISSTTFDDLISNNIISVTARMEKMCNRQFTLATYTNELHDGSDFYQSNRSILMPVNAPISSVSSIEWKSGTNSNPNWTTFSSNDYDVDEDAGIIHFHYALPRGKRNIRITYTAGWSGYSIGLSSFWTYNTVPTGDVDGANLAFTLAADADEVVVYVDGMRELDSNVTHTAGSDSITLASGRAPYSSIVVDYKQTTSTSGSDPDLPAELIDVCERAVVKLFKQRESEGKTSESFEESSITWRENLFTAEMRATIKNYRRGYSI